jgi:hypothetical protein
MHKRAYRLQAKVSCTVDQAQHPKHSPSAEHSPLKSTKEKGAASNTHSCKLAYLQPARDRADVQNKRALLQLPHSPVPHTYTAPTALDIDSKAAAIQHENTCSRRPTSAAGQAIYTFARHQTSHTHTHQPTPFHNSMLDYAAHPHITGIRAGRVRQNNLVRKAPPQAHTHQSRLC